MDAPAPTRKLPSLQPGYYNDDGHLDVRGIARRRGHLRLLEDDSSSNASALAEQKEAGILDLVDPWDLNVEDDEDGNAHLPPTLEQTEKEATPLLGPDDEPIGVTSMHADTVLGSDGTAVESLKYGFVFFIHGRRR